MLGGARTIRPPRPVQPQLRRLAAAIGLALLAGCGSSEIDRPTPIAPEAEPYRPQPAPKAVNPPSSFSIVVEESIRRKKVVEDLKRVLKESEP